MPLAYPPAEAREGGFWSYVCGVAYRLLVSHDLGGGCGAEIVNHRTTLPLSKGLSSSAAVCVLVRAHKPGRRERGGRRLAACSRLQQLRSMTSHCRVPAAASPCSRDEPPLLHTHRHARARARANTHTHTLYTYKHTQKHTHPLQVARAFNHLFGLRLTTRGEMEFAYQGETTTPSKCGERARQRAAPVPPLPL